MGAVLLATLEQFTINLGKLTFLWATVVLLGGFVGDLEKNDFYFITVLLISYGIRSFRFHNLRGVRKPKVFSWIQALVIALSVVTTIVTVFVLELGLTIFVLLLVLLSLVGGWFSAGSELSFVVIYNAALYNAEICLSLLNLGASIHWLQPPHYRYPRSNEFVAMVCFFSAVIAESSFFLYHRCCYQVAALRYVLDRKPRFLVETKWDFFCAVYETTLREGSLKGLEMNLVDHVAQKFLDSRSNRHLRKSMLMLDAVCEEQRPSGRFLLALNRGVVERLFQCMSKSYFLAYRRAAISLVARICEDDDAFFDVAQVIQGNGEYVSLLVDALEPDTNKGVLVLLRRMAEFQGIPNAEPGVTEDWDFGDEDTHQRWRDSSSVDYNALGRGDGGDGADDEQSRRKSARAVRAMLKSNRECSRYLANAASCSSLELQEIAVRVISALQE